MMKRIMFLLTLLSTVLCPALWAQADSSASTYKLRGIQQSGNGVQYAYVYAHSETRTPEGLYLECYDTAETLNEMTVAELQPACENGGNDYVAVLPEGTGVVRIKAVYADGLIPDTEYSDYYEDEDAYVYGSDVPHQLKAGYGTALVDKAPEGGGAINITGTIYKKGFGVHAAGYAIFDVSEDKYNRFVSDAGIQKGKGGLVDFILKFDEETIDTQKGVNQTNKIQWNKAIPSGTQKLTVTITDGGNTDAYDHSVLGGTRFFLTPSSPRKAQNIAWKDRIEVHAFHATDVELDAVSSSGLPVYYRITEGRDKAAIVKGNVLHVNRADAAGQIVVEAYQPGDDMWDMAPLATCVFEVSRSSIVQPGETLELKSGDVVDELIIYGNGDTSGQVQVEGLAQVRKLTYKYTFVPSQWHFISFPANLNLDKVSNLNDLGFRFNAPAGSAAYYVMEYDAEARTTNPEGNNWKLLPSPEVKANKGYIMGVGNENGMEPVEVTFSLENVNFSLDGGAQRFTTSFDFSQCEPGSTQVVYVRPKNVEGNTLRVEIMFDPSDPSSLPINHARALAEARVTHTPGYEGIRLTLPDATPAKIVIYDQKGKRLQKAVNYVSPMMIDVSDLKPGTYKMYISYGNALGERTFVLPEKKK